MGSRLIQNLTAAFLLALFCVVCFQALVLHPTDVLVGTQDQGHNDTTNIFIALKSYQKTSLQQYDQFPTWNPYSLLGMPWLGNPQSSLFYPPNWVFFFVDALKSISWMMILHHWFAGFGAYLLGRKYRLSFLSSLLSGIAFLAAPYFMAKTGEGHFTSVTQIAWFPWILYGYESLIEGHKKAIPILVLVISFAFFCGHVQELYYLLLFLSGSIIVESLVGFVRNRKAPEAEVPQTELATPEPFVWGIALSRRWFFIGLLTIGLVAVDLIPISIYTQQAVRAGGIDLQALKEGSLAPSSLLQLIDPFAWGGPDQYHGPGGYYWEAICYFGCLPLLLACLGCVTSLKNRTVIRLSLIGFISFLLAFGPHLPFYSVCHQLVPGFSMFRIPARLLWICSLVIAMLAGFGCEKIASLFATPMRSRYRNAAIACTALGMIGLIGLAIYSPAQSTPPTNTSDPGLVLQFNALLIAFTGLSAVAFSSTLSPKAARGGLILLCILTGWELSSHSRHIFETIPQSSFRNQSAITQFLQQNLGEHRVLVGQKLLSDREAWDHQIRKVQGYEPVPLVRLGLLAAATFPQKDAALMMAGYSEPKLAISRKPLLDLMSVKYAILQTDQPLKLSGWKTIARGTVPAEFSFRDTKPVTIPFLILENQNPLPRAYLIGNSQLMNTDDNSKQIVDALAAFDPRTEVLLPQDLLPAGDRQTFQSAVIRESSPTQLQIQAELKSPGYLVLSDIYYTGWSASISDQRLPVLPADFSLRAIPLPAGQHQVLVTYEPPGFSIGRVISITTLLIILILLLRSNRPQTITEASPTAAVETNTQNDSV